MIATRKISLGFLIAAFFLISGRASAALPCPATPQVYVSSGSQILCVDATTGAITVLLTDSTSSFGDIAFGPDGLLYFTDVLGSRIFRIDPKITTATAATLVANIPTGTNTITGLAFSSSNGLNNGDLYVNANTGVFLIAGIACVGCSPSLPINPTAPAITFSSAITAGGLAFDVFTRGEAETMTIVDQSGQILQSAFPFTSAKSLANVSKLGEGIFANFCGDTLVASQGTIQRLSFTTSLDKNGNLVVTVTPQGPYVNFGKSNTVQYFEVAADNTVFAATLTNGGTGSVWSVPPVKDASGVPSCSAAVNPSPTIPLVSLKSPFNGVAIGPTSITITHTFDPADQTTWSQVYNFGFHRLIESFGQVLQKFSMPFTAVRSRPADISFSSAFQLGTVPMHFSPLGGFAVQYVTPSSSNPVDGGPQNCVENPGNFQYGPCPPDSSALQMRSAYSTDDFLVDPGFALANGDAIPPTIPASYTVDLTHDVWSADTTTGTQTPKLPGLNSTYVDDNQTLIQNATVEIKSPVASCGTSTTPTCNPQFNLGQNVDFGLTLTPAPPTTTLSAATIRLSIAKVHVASDGTIQIDQFINVFSKNNADTDNIFKVGSSLSNYTYNWDSSAAVAKGLYQATIFSDSFPPVVVFLTGK